MNNRLFYILLAVVMLLGVLSIAALIAYTAELYEHASILVYIANGG
ncbi:MAG: hypothetical protein IJZ37_06925 [Clostridia bacterium]|nr:hypothetical protein [Clostridia bacterium]MBQ8236396.1 hypothetical protein [Clostridia bacterium]MBQ8398370.1 hypothetical protein [Clostridia bacterium]